MAGESASALARRQLDKAERLQASAARYQRGADGERLTAEALEVLPGSGWVVLHDVAWPGRRRANIDHVVIGRPGVFVVDTKNWSGRVTLDQGVLRQNGRSRDTSLQGVEAAADAVRAVLSAVPPDHVHAVLCLAGDQEVAGRVDGVLVCTSGDLASVLTSRPALLSEAVASIAGEARRLLGPADAPRPEPVATAPAPLRAPDVRIRRSLPPRPAWLPRALALLVAGGVAVACLTQPQLLAGPAGHVADFVTDQVSGDDPPADPPAEKPVREKKKQKKGTKDAGKKVGAKRG